MESSNWKYFKIDKLQQLILTLPIFLAAILLYRTNTDKLSNMIIHSENIITPPVAALKSHLWEIHGEKHDDPYYWLRDKTNQEVLDYLEAENKYRLGNPICYEFNTSVSAMN